MARRKSWSEKMVSGDGPRVVVLEKAMLGSPAGTRMLVSTPVEIAEAVGELRPGEGISVSDLRARLAGRHGADVTCPLTTGIFLRIVSEVALEEISAGRSIEEVVPFWRVVEPGSALARKLSRGVDFVRERRSEEGLGVSG